MNAQRAANPRQGPLTGVLRCYYDDASYHHLRPHCQGVAVVAYGPTLLCASCEQMRSSVGKGTIPRAVPGAELARLIDAARTAADANDRLDLAAHDARHAGASWTQIGDALRLTRQAAQQRWGHPRPTPHTATTWNDPAHSRPPPTTKAQTDSIQP